MGSALDGGATAGALAGAGAGVGACVGVGAGVGSSESAVVCAVDAASEGREEVAAGGDSWAEVVDSGEAVAGVAECVDLTRSTLSVGADSAAAGTTAGAVILEAAFAGSADGVTSISTSLMATGTLSTGFGSGAAGGAVGSAGSAGISFGDELEQPMDLV